MSHVLTLNAGSSSLKFGLFDAAPEPRHVAHGLVENIGAQAHLVLWVEGRGRCHDALLPLAQAGDHSGALEAALGAFETAFPQARIEVVGHRVVHGGMAYGAPCEITDAVIETLDSYVSFAPLHQPHNLAGVRAAIRHFPKARQIACFDTAFHRGHDRVTDAFALPRRYYDKGVRRYGFHGLSYEFIASRLQRLHPDLHAGRVVVAHLGNGASLCAMKGGRSVASTMGFSALDGLCMGTRCGQLDPGVLLYMLRQEGLSSAQIEHLLYTQSGLLGLSGIASDMRTLLDSPAPEAAQAVAHFCARIRAGIGAMAAELEGIDGVIFTAGIGEHAAPVREQVCAGLGWLGLELDTQANDEGRQIISADGSTVTAMVLATDEERVIARAGVRLLMS